MTGNRIEASHYALKNKSIVCLNHGYFYKYVGRHFKNQKEESLPDLNALTPLNGRSSGVIVNKMLKFDEHVKEADIEGINANDGTLKIITMKYGLKDEMGDKNSHRATRSDCAFKMMLLEEDVM